MAPGEQLRDPDEGEYTDTDVVDEHRHVPEEGSYRRDADDPRGTHVTAVQADGRTGATRRRATTRPDRPPDLTDP